MCDRDRLNAFVQKSVGFDARMKGINFISAENGGCVGIIKLTEDHLNVFGGMHGGFAATLVDCVSGYGLTSYKPWFDASPSVTLNISFLSPAKLGDELKITSTLMRAGKSLAFLEIEIRNAANDELLVKGELTKYKIAK